MNLINEFSNTLTTSGLYEVLIFLSERLVSEVLTDVRWNLW